MVSVSISFQGWHHTQDGDHGIPWPHCMLFHRVQNPRTGRHRREWPISTWSAVASWLPTHTMLRTNALPTPIL